MKVVVIEDELLMAEDLVDAIRQAAPQAEVVAVLHSVKEAIQYFKNNSMPHIIFSDIQLGDGLSFDIFTAIDIKIPVVFCTAFDDYAIKAFNASGIHYVLKPFNVQKIREAFDKYHTLQSSFSTVTPSFEEIIAALQLNTLNGNNRKVASVLVYYQNKIIPIKLQDIALFYIKNETTHLFTFDHKTYVVNKTLDELQQYDEELFYRANRQFIVSRHAIKEASNYMARKISIVLNVSFEETITISKEKATPFFEWLMGVEE